MDVGSAPIAAFIIYSSRTGTGRLERFHLIRSIGCSLNGFAVLDIGDLMSDAVTRQA